MYWFATELGTKPLAQLSSVWIVLYSNAENDHDQTYVSCTRDGNTANNINSNNDNDNDSDK